MRFSFIFQQNVHTFIRLKVKKDKHDRSHITQFEHKQHANDDSNEDDDENKKRRIYIFQILMREILRRGNVSFLHGKSSSQIGN